ncbi:MBL fold metallo-hydrolase [Candidatus Peregrinibacteria bacterium]|nr:MBL fold metallo-hydrolase [Candidatus Peregrinibacteria bacterium]
MKIHFHGAAHGVTGSKHLIEINGKNILLDCGFFQGKRKLSYEMNKYFSFDPKSIDAMILSHAHIDHSGNIPGLVKNGYTKKIYCTDATKDLTLLMLLDSAHIQESDAEFFLKHQKSLQPEIPIEPLYTMEDAEKSSTLLVGKKYHERFEVLPGIFCTFYDAGHVLGSAVILLDFLENGKEKRLIFTGDLGREGKVILRDPEAPDSANYIITESTYGDRFHEPFPEMRGEMGKVVSETAQKGGKIIIPSFSLERTQEIVYDLHMLYKENRTPKIPIYVDSPLATNLTKIFQSHPECYDEQTRKDFLNVAEDPFQCLGYLKYTRSVDESKALNFHQGPCIIISASGMCEAGRIRHHLRNSVEDPKNTILIVGYQAEHTLGRRIVERRPFIKVFGEMLRLRADVKILNGYSGHGDANDLVSFIQKVNGLSCIFIVHGEISQSEGLLKRLRKVNPKWIIEIPKMGDVLDPETLLSSV